jgi:flagellar hook-length control protein FliK
MASNNESRAELVLNPPQLGRIEVSLTVNGDQANAVFVSANPAVREALENAVPHLREILGDAGINLGQAQVGAESSQQSSNQGQTGDNRSSRLVDGGGEETAMSSFIGSTQTTRIRQGNGLVDTFA